MKENKILKINGTVLDKKQLENYLEKFASNHNLMSKPEKNTYPIPHMKESFKIIEQVYNLLNEHLKLRIAIHPAGEWLLDNLYIIEQTVRQVEKEMTLRKYLSFSAIANGQYKGFARIYVLASEIVAYTDNIINKDDLSDYLKSYQSKRTLSMEELWNIGIFIQIALIENIREICEKIYSVQMQKLKAENIVERLVENKNKKELIYSLNSKIKLDINDKDIKYPFIEYMSYILKRYGKKGFRYLNALEETVEMYGTSISEIIKKEHFDIAVRKVSIGNSITSMKTIQRINFLEVFEKVNGVEEILKQDPAGVYQYMDDKTKDYYRAKIKEISKKSKISEIYIARKILGLAKAKSIQSKETHIGYYLIDKGQNELYNILKINKLNRLDNKLKTKIYISSIIILSLIISLGISLTLGITNNLLMYLISTIIFFIPATEISIQLIQYILSKIVKPKIIPKMKLKKGISKENSTMVIIPTILKSKDKVEELMEKLEVFYLANKSPNIYFTLLGDCSEENEEEKEFDNEVINVGKKKVKELNEKYNCSDNKIPLFNFIYRKRTFNEKENKYMGWERKRGMITQFNEYLLGNIESPFRENTIEDYINNIKEGNEIRNILKNIRYVITLDADTDLILNSAFELIGAMSHILNKPVIDKEKNIVVDGYGIIQPRVGVDLDISFKTIFTKIFAGNGGFDSYTNAISDIYQDNFGEGIYTGKGIYDLHVFSKVLKNEIPENTVLSHDLLEGSYLRCGLASDILLIDGYPTKYSTFMNRLSRWIRGDWQILKWISKKSPLNILSKYKIIDNLRRSLLEISLVVGIIYSLLIGKIYMKNIVSTLTLLTVICVFPYILNIINRMIFKKEGEEKQKTFSPRISGYKGDIISLILTLGCLPYKAYISLKAIVKTIYRMKISKKNLLEWMTSEEAEKQALVTIYSYNRQMLVNIIFGIIFFIIGACKINILFEILGILCIITPSIMWYISKEGEKEEKEKKLDNKEREYLDDIAKKTWDFFKDYLTEENNYLIPDNYQEDRKQKIVQRTSSTNIGLSLLAVISAYDLKYIDLEETKKYLSKIIMAISKLEKWNGHLYNWYNTKTTKPLIPRYISTVDSRKFSRIFICCKNFFRGKYAKQYGNIYCK